MRRILILLFSLLLVLVFNLNGPVLTSATRTKHTAIWVVEVICRRTTGGILAMKKSIVGKHKVVLDRPMTKEQARSEAVKIMKKSKGWCDKRGDEISTMNKIYEYKETKSKREPHRRMYWVSVKCFKKDGTISDLNRTRLVGEQRIKVGPTHKSLAQQEATQKAKKITGFCKGKNERLAAQPNVVAAD